LVDFDWNVKVSDFGLSRVIEGGSNEALTFCGTTAWAAPEVLREHKYCLKADVYSFGICLWEMCTREEPYKDLTSSQVVIAVAVNGQRPPIDKAILHDFVNLMTSCWGEIPEERPDFLNLLKKFSTIKCPKTRNRKPYSKTGSSSSVETFKAKNNSSNYLTPKSGDSEGSSISTKISSRDSTDESQPILSAWNISPL